MIRLIRKTELISRCGRTNSGVYADIADELMPPPVKLGARMSAWPEHEIEAVLRARIAGKSADEIRALVRELVAARLQAD